MFGRRPVQVSSSEVSGMIVKVLAPPLLVEERVRAMFSLWVAVVVVGAG